MDKLFAEPLFYIFFIYGMSFMVMANIIIGGITSATSITLVSTFYMLAFFGVAHGICELTDWARIIGKTLGRSENVFLLYTSQIFLIVSFVLLLQFAVNLLTYKSEKKGLVRAIPAVLFAAYLAVVFYLGISNISKMGLIARYSFGFAGAALSAIMLFRLGGAMKSLGNRKLVRGLNFAGAGFGAYAVFGGLIVTPVFGLPVQLFRAACAVVIAIASYAILDVFRVE
ncbi:MAG: hypothetical protein ACM3MD_08320 [Betaproteobacteria bacterium]